MPERWTGESPPAPGADDLPAPGWQQLDHCQLFLGSQVSQVQGGSQEDPVVPGILPSIVREDILVGPEGVLRKELLQASGQPSTQLIQS